MATTDSTLAELTQAAKYATDQQSIHWPRCRARGRLEWCLTCESNEDRIIETDLALRHYWANLSQEVA